MNPLLEEYLDSPEIKEKLDQIYKKMDIKSQKAMIIDDSRCRLVYNAEAPRHGIAEKPKWLVTVG